jgi:hypothetical protein
LRFLEKTFTPLLAVQILMSISAPIPDRTAFLAFSCSAGKLLLVHQSDAVLFSFAPAGSGCAPFLVLQGQARKRQAGGEKETGRGWRLMTMDEYSRASERRVSLSRARALSSLVIMKVPALDLLGTLAARSV